MDVVQTQYDTSFSFSSKQYYLLPDSIPVISGNSNYVKTSREKALEDTIISTISSSHESG
ncbi:MAG: hypothetical protein HC905_12960, partial [Bacteroidales bacterium]|nr:hypothetical protein [Bacteroidales bacterium]